MVVISQNLDLGWVVLFSILFLIALTYAIAKFDWLRCTTDIIYQRSFFGGLTLLLLVWQVKGYFMDGVQVHLLGICVCCLLLGIEGAIVAAVIVAVLLELFTGDGFNLYFGVNLFCSVLVPVIAVLGIIKLERLLGAKNFFSFIYIAGFFGGAASALAGATAMFSVLWFGGVLSWEELYSDYLQYVPLLMLPEAFISGMLITGLVVFYPDYLTTLEEYRYGGSD